MMLFSAQLKLLPMMGWVSIFDDFWQVRSPTIEIPRQYSAYTPPHFKNTLPIPQVPASFNKNHTPPTLQTGKRYPAASCK
jgi:hypothetical protein